MNKGKKLTDKNHGKDNRSDPKMVSCTECGLPNGRHTPHCTWSVANLP